MGVSPVIKFRLEKFKTKICKFPCTHILPPPLNMLKLCPKIDPQKPKKPNTSKMGSMTPNIRSDRPALNT